jgi:type II secretory pathway component PulM
MMTVERQRLEEARQQLAEMRRRAFDALDQLRAGNITAAQANKLNKVITEWRRAVKASLRR